MTTTTTKIIFLLKSIYKKNFKFEYKASEIQINYLQYYSNFATQEITFLCRNTIAHRDENYSTTRSIKFLAWNDLPIDATGRIKYKVLLDECSVRFPFFRNKKNLALNLKKNNIF